MFVIILVLCCFLIGFSNCKGNINGVWVLWSLIYISFVLLINWIPLTGQKTLMVCDFVLIDFVCDVIRWCAVFLGF